MKHFRIKVKYNEPMMADAIFKGEDEDSVREEFVAYAVARGMESVEVIEIDEISEEEANEFRKAYQQERVLQ